MTRGTSSGERAKSGADRTATRERIIEAAEFLLRRHGPAKTRVVDVARHLKMSHANVYRHFDSKANLEDIVAARWLASISRTLEPHVKEGGSAERRLRDWIDALVTVMERMAKDDPELFATYNGLAEASRQVIKEHSAHQCDQIARIIADGVAQEEFHVRDVNMAADVVHAAIARFQHPYFVTRQQSRSAALGPVVDILVAGLKTGAV